MPFSEWLAQEKRLLLHAGGQSRRLPAYAPSGKVLTPIPVFRWERGQVLSQDLLSLQIPFYERILDMAPASYHTMIVSGDVLIRTTKPLPTVPEADVVCYGLWLNDEIASTHGVFVTDRQSPSVLKCMLQKPSASVLAELRHEHLYMVDIGIWLLSDKAVKVLTERSMQGDEVVEYDMYSTFGGAMGAAPVITDPEVNALKVAVIPLPGGEFYHYGTSPEIISSTVSIQNLVNDQREIMHRSRKPHPSIFVQNAQTWIPITNEHRNLWIENSCISEQWTLSQENIVTGVPENDWQIALRPGQCVDIVPIGESQWAVRPYGFHDSFRGALNDATTSFIGKPFPQWAEAHGVDIESVIGHEDLQSACVFPVVD